MRSRLTKKRMLTLASVLVIALAGIAYAFYSSTGTGSGAGSAASGDGSSITVTGTVTNAVAPGGSSPITFTASNGTSTAGTIRKIHLGSVTTDAGHSTCDMTKCTMTDVTPATPIAVAASAGDAPLGSSADG